LVRNTSSLASFQEYSSGDKARLAIYAGSPADKKNIEKAMDGCEAVLSVLNISRTSDFPWSPLRTGDHFLSEVLTHTVDLCQQKNIRRIIITTAWGVNETRAVIPSWFRWIIDHSNVGVAYRDHERQEFILQKTGLAWTAVRPVGLTNSKKEKEIHISLNNEGKPRLMISRKNVACFMIRILEENTYIRQAPVIFE
jgi:NAD(P)H-binding